ncbi:MAG: Bpu10I family restriction endonuclease, partial [Phascolarctobacterium sp.]|nr:Bpu10I family restriction endonuclease [Candidatus Phascolarctobacterium caballi]
FFTGANFQDFIASPSIGINSKNQDFAIYRQTELIVNNERKNICLPIVALENKTYIDKTMLEGSIATAEKIKSGNPYCLFCIVTETYEVSFDVDPAYSRIDQIFVLRKSSLRNGFQPIDFDVVYNLVNKINSHLERQWSDVEQKMLTTGEII